MLSFRHEVARALPPLRGMACSLRGSGAASDYAASLLGSLGAAVDRGEGFEDEHPAQAWARSGLMALTGQHAAAPRMCPAPLASCADGVTAAMSALSESQGTCRMPAGSGLLAERAALSGLQPRGAISAGGGCRLLQASDGMLALNIARNEDRELLSAWLETDTLGSWTSIEEAVAGRKAHEVVERGRLIGLALAPSERPSASAWYSASAAGFARQAPGPNDRPLVVDLSSLWAGPLCSQLLQRLGARVIKVESTQRPDGARRGWPAFFDLLNAEKCSLALDFSQSCEIEKLRRLLSQADIVIEASRPRALRQLGLDAEEILADRPGLTWLSITGYGREGAEAQWIAYGDDAGVAAGLSCLMQEASGEALFCGDAIADPLTGLHAALAAWAGYRGGGGLLLSVAMRDVVAHCAGFGLPRESSALRERWSEWQAIGERVGAAAPVARAALKRARPLGADNAAVLAACGIPC